MSEYAKMSIALAIALFGFAAGWQINGTRMKAKLADIQNEHNGSLLVALQREQDKERAAQASIDNLTKYTQDEIDKHKVVAANSRSESERLRKQLATYTARAKNPSTAGAGQSEQGASALDVLSDLLTRVDSAAGDLAVYADELKVRGLACERAYSAISINTKE